MNRSSNTWWGIVLIVVGALLFLDNYYDLDFGELIRTWWPLLLVIWGIGLVLRHTSESRPQETPSTAGSSSSGAASPEHVDQSSIFGDTVVRVSSQSFRGGTISTVFGDTTIDLSSAGLGDGEHVLKVSGVFGDTTISLPQDMAFSATVNTLFGDVKVIDQEKEGFGSTITFQVPEYTVAAKKLRIQTSQVFGDIVVRR